MSRRKTNLILTGMFQGHSSGSKAQTTVLNL